MRAAMRAPRLRLRMLLPLLVAVLVLVTALATPYGFSRVAFESFAATDMPPTADVPVAAVAAVAAVTVPVAAVADAAADAAAAVAAVTVPVAAAQGGIWELVPTVSKGTPIPGGVVTKGADGSVEWTLGDGNQESGPDHNVVFYGFKPQPFAPGDTVTLRMAWTTKTIKADQTAVPCFDRKGVNTGDNAIGNNRCMFGTGDFRIGVFDALAHAGTAAVLKPENQRKYPGIHVRTFPHLGPAYGDRKYNSGNPGGHSNLSTWFRLAPGRFPGLMDDNCQETVPAKGGPHDHCGFGMGLYTGPYKGKTRTLPATGSAPDAPYDKPFPVEIKFTRVKEDSYIVTVTQNRETINIANCPLAGLALGLKQVSLVGFTYTNHRNYQSVTLRDFEVLGANDVGTPLCPAV